MQIWWSGTIESKGDMSWFGLFWMKTAESDCKNCKVSWGSLKWRSGAKNGLRDWSGKVQNDLWEVFWDNPRLVSV